MPGVRFAHSLAFFTATAYGPTQTAERAARAVRAMHHTIKGTRPDGVAYNTELGPEWLRWNYTTVVWGIASTHGHFRAQAIKRDDIDDYYGAFVRVGEALGGTDLPRTKGETLDCLQSYLPKLAAHPRRGDDHRVRTCAMPQSAVDWAIRDTMPKWAKQLIGHTDPNPIERAARRAIGLVGHQRAAHRGRHHPWSSVRPRPASRAEPPVPHTEPTYVLGSDPELSRDEVEHSFA